MREGEVDFGFREFKISKYLELLKSAYLEIFSVQSLFPKSFPNR
jgi:hypothetical protein